MKYSEKIKPITFLKNHTSEIMKEVTNTAIPVIITHNGEARLIIQDIKVYEEQKNALTLLKLLAQSTESMKKSRYKPIKDSFNSIREKISNIHEKV